MLSPYNPFIKKKKFLLLHINYADREKNNLL